MRLGFVDAAVELQLQCMEVEEIRVVQAGFACALHQRQRLWMLADALLYMSQGEQCGTIAAGRYRRVRKAMECSQGFAEPGQGLRDAADQGQVGRQRRRRRYQLLGSLTNTSTRQHYRGQQQAYRRGIGVATQQCLQQGGRLVPPARSHVALGFGPGPAVEGVDGCAPGAGARAFMRLHGMIGGPTKYAGCTSKSPVASLTEW